MSKLILEPLESRILLSSGEGQLRIDNIVNSFNNYCTLNHIWGAELGLDSYDNTNWMAPFEGSSIYSLVESTNCFVDSQPVSNTSFDNIKLVYEGSLGESTSNLLKVQFPYSEYEFATKPLTLEEDNGQRTDIRQSIANGDGGTGIGVIPLEDLPAGSYNANTPYATPKVHFKKTADLNNDGIVNLQDYALMAKNWQNYEGMPDPVDNYLLGDITGVDGVPDGSVDISDLEELASQWLESE